MANYSDLTRKEQVLKYLQDHADQWVDGPQLSNKEVGGSEGLKRVRELRAEGHTIKTRPHPDHSRDIFQYKLVTAPLVVREMWIKEGPTPALDAAEKASREPEIPFEYGAGGGPTPGLAGRQFLMRRNEDGTFELTKEVCVDCGGMYDDDLEHRTTDSRHLRWIEAQRKQQGDQLVVGVPEQPPPMKFTEMPTKIDMATMQWCPRCGGRRRKGRTYYNRKLMQMVTSPDEDFTRDPFHPTIKGEPNPCQRCGGFGVVPVFVTNGQTITQVDAEYTET